MVWYGAVLGEILLGNPLILVVDEISTLSFYFGKTLKKVQLDAPDLSEDFVFFHEEVLVLLVIPPFVP